MSKLYIQENLVRIQPLIYKILCRQEKVMPIPTPMPIQYVPLPSGELSMKFFMLIDFKLPTIDNSLLLIIAEHENFSANKYENANYCWHFHIY